jgi:non-ribosomal peptide synthase protein (TIGR01720 family)
MRNNGVYLITGGLGGLGLELADYLVQRTRGKLALVGRTLLLPREEWSNWLRVHDAIDITSIRIRRILNLEAAGAELLLLQADVADATQMTAVIRAIEAEFGPIAGVVHAAGAEKSAAPLAGLTRIDCEKQFTSRTQGLRVLAEVLQERQLDFCLVNSSLASTMGVMGFAAYTAAHLSMDAFVASIAQSFDYPWLTVNWDNWNLQGGPAMTEYYMNPADAKQVLDRILDIGASPQTIVSSGDLRARVAQWVKAESVATDAADFKNVDTFAADGHPRPELSTPYIEPNNNVERTLAAIWRDMLGIDRVGVHDNFFELGGDSVLNIQITARANKAGLKLTPKQVFEHQTIAALAAVAGAAGTEKTVNAEPVTGPVPLTPIQHWFFERTPAAASHFNLPLLLQTRRALNPSVLAEAIARVERHHDALRMRYARTDNGWSQEIVAPGSTSPVTQINLIGQTREEQVRAIEEHGTKLQTSLDISTGPVLCAALFDLGANQSGRLLLVAHHLMMDMIGWRIFLEDLQMAYQSLDGGHEPAFPAKTTSIKTWSMRLGQYANSTTAESELEAWCALGKESQRRLPLDFASGDNSVASSDRVVVELDPEETRALLTDLPRLCQSQIQDALLLGVVEALSEWIGSEALWVDLEGHGREAMLDDVDVSRTIGWFTTIAPLALPLPRSLALTERLQFVHQRLQAMPNHGMGFGILRYLNQHVGIKERLAALPLPEISFLYMGQFDQAFAGDSWFAPAPESAGPPHDPSGQRHHLLSINSIVSQGRLHVSWTYGRHLHRKETILRLANAHLAALRAMLAKSTAAPSLPGKQFSTDVSAADLAEIARQIQLATGTET